MRIAAVVVTYNRKELLRECLASLIHQTYTLDEIILVNNASTDGTEEMLKEAGYLNNERINYIAQQENEGGAGGFCKGIETGVQKGFDWLWIMDDDCIPAHNALEVLINHGLFLDSATVALCNKVLKIDKGIHFGTRRYIDGNFKETISMASDYENDYFEIDLFSFVGVLLKSESIKKIGLPIKEYFIFFDDTEYSMRLCKIGKIYVISSSEVLHKAPMPVMGENWAVTWRLFFLTRNPIHMFIKHIINSNTNLAKKILLFLRVVILQNVLKPLIRPFVRSIYKGERIVYLKIVSKAIYQGITGNFNNDLSGLTLLLNKNNE